MPTLTLFMHYDPRERQRDLFVDLGPDEDSLPFEHEQNHKSLVDRLVHGGTFKAAANQRLTVEREENNLPTILMGGCCQEVVVEDIG